MVFFVLQSILVIVMYQKNSTNFDRNMLHNVFVIHLMNNHFIPIMFFNVTKQLEHLIFEEFFK
jgi:tryptophan-rich sensory protein